MAKLEEKAKQVWICMFCATPYETEEEASKCWGSHSHLTIDYVYGGIGSGTDMPEECVIKKHERGFITQIATYTLKEVKNVRMRDRNFGKKEG